MQHLQTRLTLLEAKLLDDNICSLLSNNEGGIASVSSDVLLTVSYRRKCPLLYYSLPEERSDRPASSSGDHARSGSCQQHPFVRVAPSCKCQESARWSIASPESSARVPSRPLRCIRPSSRPWRLARPRIQPRQPSSLLESSGGCPSARHGRSPCV